MLKIDMNNRVYAVLTLAITVTSLLIALGIEKFIK